MALIAPGTCRHCGCTENNACRLGDGDTCAWIDRTRIVCSNPSCIMAEAARTREYEGRVRANQIRFSRERREQRNAKFTKKRAARGKGRAA